MPNILPPPIILIASQNILKQLPYQQLGEKKKFGINPDIVRFDELGEISEEG
jgi:hypothetical protein